VNADLQSGTQHGVQIPPVSSRPTPSEWSYYTEDALRCKCGCGVCAMDDDAVEVFDLLRYQATQRWGADLPFIVTSGYRCPTYDSSPRVGGMGLHPTGCCIDIAVLDARKRWVILRMAFSHPRIFGVGIGEGMLHLDTIRRDRPRVWTY